MVREGRIQTVTLKRGYDVIHVETDLGIVNINMNLTDLTGSRVETIQLIPNDYASAPKITVDGKRLNRFIEHKESKQ